MFLIEYLQWFLSSFQFILVATSISFLLKFCILFVLIRRIVFLEKIERPVFFLLTILIGNMFSDFAWILKLSRLLIFPQLNYQIVLLFTRIAWIFFIIQYQSLALFLESLVIQKYKPCFRQKLYCVISGLFCSFFAIIAALNFNCVDGSQRFEFEATIQNISIFYVLFPLILPSLFITLQKIRHAPLPLILKKQLFVLINGLILPVLIADFIQVCPFRIRALEALAHNYTAVSFTTIFLTLAIYFCARKIFGLRFLNLKNHVQQAMNINFIDDFKGVLERLSSVKSLRELGHVTQGFFKDTFSIPIARTHLYLRDVENSIQDKKLCLIENTSVSMVETFLVTHQHTIETSFKEEKILIYDEIDFTHFYDECEKSKLILHFLRIINADIFLPIYENDKLIAYIIVERHARTGNFYSNVERDELIVFSNYLGNIINLLQNQRLEILIEQEQYLRKELYHKHQEINQYKESIRSFMRKSKSQHIGILFYKNKQFIYGNQAAKELISININLQQGHPLAQTLRSVAQQVESFKAPQSTFTKNTDNNSLVISAVPHLEQNTVIITVSYPDISDTIKHSIDLLKDPTEWDYLLYLQTTESGKLINKLIPGDGFTLLNFKIELLKVALSKKAILLDMIDQDLQSTAEIVNHISMRDELHVITLQGQSHNFDIAIKLFGINPIFGISGNHNRPLLETLNGVGTLFIKNIHFLDLETQDALALFIRYGFYTIFKSDQKITSDVRIICSSNQNLSLLTQAGRFSKELFQELKTTTLSMPSLIGLPEDELQTLTDGFTQQALTNDALDHILLLNDKEKRSFIDNRPISLQELKTRVQQLLIKKSKKNKIYQEVTFNNTYDVTDPDLIAAARLGKQALKDQRVMMLLWNKFKNQNKISTFLGVNRSSVNRRCKEYNLL